MSKGNKRAKEALIRLYGPECFIDKLHLRPDTDRRYTGKGQYEKMKRLTYHHIKERCKGGPATVENGALLSEENHQWFNKQSKEKQAEMNAKFQEYKKCKVVLVDEEEFESPIQVKAMEFSLDDLMPKKKKFNRAKEKVRTQRIIDEDLYR